MSVPSGWIDFKELRAKLCFSEVFEHYKVKLVIKGDRATGFCPLPTHQGQWKSPSFSAHLERSIWQCFGCGAKGNVLDFACRMEGFDPTDARQFRQGALKVAVVFNINAAQDSNGLLPNRPIARTGRKTDASSPPASSSQTSGRRSIVNAPLDFELKNLDVEHTYLTGRGFLPETIRHFGLGFCNRGLMKGRIVIPLHDASGRLIGYAGRITKDSMIGEECPKYRFPGEREHNGMLYQFRKSEFLYNGYRIRSPVNDLIVVEGFTSVWWLHQHGYNDVVALMGSSLSPKQGELLHSLLHLDGRLWIFTDGDKAGEDCAHAVFADLARHRNIRRVKLDGGQPTDLHQDEIDALFGGNK